MESVPKTKKFEAIKGLSEKGYAVTILCDIAGVTRGGYYKWIKRQLTPSEKQLEDTEIKKKILECHKKFKGIYGY
ncbi:transposase, partial [Brevibacillus laterosporus]